MSPPVLPDSPRALRSGSDADGDSPLIPGGLPAVTLDPQRRRQLGDRLEAAAQQQQRRRRLARTAAAVGAAGALAATLALVFGLRPFLGPERPERSTSGQARLRTGAGDFQLLPLGERAVAFVGEHSELEVLPDGPLALRVHRGSVRLIVKRRPGEPFVVATPAAEVEVRGTEFDVSVNEGTTEVKVVRGEVEVRNPHGRRRLWARESARATPGHPPRMIPVVRGLVTEGGPDVVVQPPGRRGR